MEWYYAQEQKQIGPINDSEFRNLVENGTILSDTLVWNSSMDDWTTYGKVITGQLVDSEETSSIDDPFSFGEPFPSEYKTTPDEGPKLYCSECGGVFSKDEMVRYEDSLICAACKPIFMQKLKGSVGYHSDLEYAGFWLRFSAKIIDIITMVVILMIFLIPLYLVMGASIIKLPSGQATDMANNYIFYSAVFIFSLVVLIGYSTLFVGSYSATPGKMVCNVKVVSADGSRVTYLRAFTRFFGEMISNLIFGVGYIMAAFDEQKRTLHDRISSTRVIKKNDNLWIGI